MFAVIIKIKSTWTRAPTPTTPASTAWPRPIPPRPPRNQPIITIRTISNSVTTTTTAWRIAFQAWAWTISNRPSLVTNWIRIATDARHSITIRSIWFSNRMRFQRIRDTWMPVVDKENCRSQRTHRSLLILLLSVIRSALTQVDDRSHT